MVVALAVATAAAPAAAMAMAADAIAATHGMACRLQHTAVRGTLKIQEKEGFSPSLARYIHVPSFLFYLFFTGDAQNRFKLK